MELCSIWQRAPQMLRKPQPQPFGVTKLEQSQLYRRHRPGNLLPKICNRTTRAITPQKRQKSTLDGVFGPSTMTSNENHIRFVNR